MKILFYNVDTQVDFIEPNGKLYVKGAEDIKPNLKKLTDYARDNGYYILNSADAHYKDSEELSEVPDYINTFPPHCMIGTPGAEFIMETKPKNPVVINWYDNDYNDDLYNDENLEWVLTKDKFDVFLGSDYSDIIISKFNDFDKVVVYGVVSEICVRFAVEGLLERGFKVELVEDAIKSLDYLKFKKLLNKWQLNKNFNLVKVEDVIK